MKWTLMLLAILVLFAGCESVEITGERLKEVNDQWFKMYTSDRRMTKAEAAEYAALDEAGKTEWRAAGRPTDRVMSTRTLDATLDFHKAVGMEADAAKDK